MEDLRVSPAGPRGSIVPPCPSCHGQEEQCPSFLVGLSQQRTAASSPCRGGGRAASEPGAVLGEEVSDSAAPTRCEGAGSTRRGVGGAWRDARSGSAQHPFAAGTRARGEEGRGRHLPGRSRTCCRQRSQAGGSRDAPLDARFRRQTTNFPPQHSVGSSPSASCAAALRRQGSALPKPPTPLLSPIS